MYCLFLFSYGIAESDSEKQNVSETPGLAGKFMVSCWFFNVPSGYVKIAIENKNVDFP